jgi:hypothetical protein
VVTPNSGPAAANPNNEIWVPNPDLSKVDEIGFADLIPGSGHGTGGYIQLGVIEVYGKSVPRYREVSTKIVAPRVAAKTTTNNARPHSRKKNPR